MNNVPLFPQYMNCLVYKIGLKTVKHVNSVALTDQKAQNPEIFS